MVQGHVVDYDDEKDRVIKGVIPGIVRVECHGIEKDFMRRVEHRIASQMSVRWDKLSSHKIASKFREITASTTNLPLYVCRALIELHVKNGIMIQPTIGRDCHIVSMKFTFVDLYLGYLYYLGDMPVCLCNAVVHSVYRDQTGQRLSFFTQRISIVPTYS
jgi:hypothetical protein